MEVVLSVYHARKTLLWNTVVAVTSVALLLAKGWVAVPEAINGWDTPIQLAAVLVALFLICGATNFVSGHRYHDACGSGGSKGPVPVLPYWIPYFGHLLQLVWDKTSFLKKARNAHTQNVFALNLAGINHVIVASPFLISAIDAKDATSLEEETFVSTIRKNVFGLWDEVPSGNSEAPAVLSNAFYERVFAAPHVDSLTKKALMLLKENIPDLATFNESVVDQPPWERVSWTSVIQTSDGRDFSETNLLLLIREFVGHIINTAFAGVAFLEDYPNFHEDLQVLEDKFFLLATGLPRWVPIPGLPAGYIARKRLLQQLGALKQKYDKELQGEDVISTEQDVGDFSAVYTAGQQITAASEVPPAARAASDLSVIWALNASARDLVFWMLVHILAEPGLAERIRTEARPYASATQPPNDFGIPEPPRLAFDMDGLLSKCPLLSSCYMETVRLYNNAWSVRKVKGDLVVGDGTTGGKPVVYQVKKGDYIDVSNRVHNTDERTHRAADRFMPVRFTRTEEAGQIAEGGWGSVRHDNGMWQMNGTADFAERLCLATVASLLAVWEVEPVDKAGWRVPRSCEAPLVARPRDDVRVRISRRGLVVEPGK